MFVYASGVPELLVIFLAATVVVILVTTAMIIGVSLSPPRRTAAWAIARGLPSDPGEMDRSFRAWDAGTGRTRRPVWEIEGDGPADAPAVIIIHGWAMSRVVMLERIAPFLAVAPRVLVVDRPGHGEASGYASFGAGESAHLARVIDGAEADGDHGGSVVLAAWSIGLLAAIELAASDTRICGVVSIAGCIDVPHSMRARLAEAEVPRIPFAWCMALALRIRERFSGRSIPDAVAFAPQIRCPLLIVHGTNDVVAPIERLDVLAQSLSGAAKCTWIRVEGAGHARLDLHPDARLRETLHDWWPTVPARTFDTTIAT